MADELTDDVDDTDTEDDDSLPLRELLRIAGGQCRDCTTGFSAREGVWSIALGFKNAPRCLPCLSRRLGRDESDLRGSLTDYVYRRECYLRAWREAERMDDATDEPSPPTPPPGVPSMSEPSPPTDSTPTPDEVWDAGDMGCGELVMALRLKLKNQPAGSVIQVTATDPAAPEDLPSWCRLTGHTLLTATHPVYLIRRKED